MDFASSDFLTELLKFFEMHCITGFLALQPYAWQLCSVLAIIDLGTTWTLYSGEVRMSALISRAIKVDFSCSLSCIGIRSTQPSCFLSSMPG